MSKFQRFIRMWNLLAFEVSKFHQHVDGIVWRYGIYKLAHGVFEIPQPAQGIVWVPCWSVSPQHHFLMLVCVLSEFPQHAYSIVWGLWGSYVCLRGV